MAGETPWLPSELFLVPQALGQGSCFACSLGILEWEG